MNALIALLLAALCLASCTSLWLRRNIAQLRQRVVLAEARCDAARDGEASVTRALQLFALELQALGLTLRGHADRLAAEQHRHAPSLATAAAQLGGLADELCHHLLPADQSHGLDCAWVDLAELVREAVAELSAAIHPGRRHWRVPATPAETTLWADRRALRLLLIRVLGEAARSSTHDDFIDIFWRVTADGLAIHVEDEGAGTARPEAAPDSVLDTRGIGLRLSLARSLTQAHGGTLEVEAQARIGTSVTITLPASRLAAQMAEEAG
jgi:signal transduction histidine kinase